MGPGVLDSFQPTVVPIALRVPDVAEARKTLEAAGATLDADGSLLP